MPSEPVRDPSAGSVTARLGRVIAASAAVVVVAVSAELFLRRLGTPPALALFLGRFHPLLVHLPIGFVLLIGLAEAATLSAKLRARVEPTLGLLLPVTVAAALAAFLLGQLLSLEGGFPAEALRWHRRLTLVAVIGMSLCWLAFELQQQKALRHGRLAYRGLLGATLGVLSLGAHFGGTMTRGDAYLSKYAPDALKPLLGGASLKAEPPKKAAPAAAAPAEPLLFADAVLPILKEHCVECHGPEKTKGGLRMDTLELLVKGGENGAVIVAGDSGKSPLVQRVLLPMSDDDRMPPEDRDAPKPAELALLKFWIERGASATLRVRDVLAPADSRALLEGIAAGAAKAPGKAAPSAGARAAAPGSAEPSGSSAPARQEAAPEPAPGAEQGASAKAGGAATSANTESVAESAADGAEPKPAASVRSGGAFLQQYCEKCHGANKQKGKLRVDSLEALLRGGKDDGAAIVAGDPEHSPIVLRTRLPLSSDEHMPPKKEPQPSSAELGVLASWVRAQGRPTAAAQQPKPASADTVPASSLRPSPTETSASEPAAKPATPAAEPTREAAAAESRGASPERAVHFADVQPLLREKCGKCHIREKPAGGLRVAERKELLAGGFSGPGVVPRDTNESLLLARVVLPLSDDEHMPPEGEPQLALEEIARLRAWIEQGAPERAAEGAPRPAADDAASASGASVAKAGGCAACTVPGGASSGRLGEPVTALLAGLSLLGLRRRVRRARRARR